MRFLPLLSIFTAVLFASYFCSTYGEEMEQHVFVSGKIECSDCAARNAMPEVAYKGLHVAIKCKSNELGEYETEAVGGLDKNGIYNFQLPSKLVGEKGELKKECFAQLHNSETNTPCPQDNKEPAEASKLVVQFKKNGAQFLSTSSKLPVSVGTCASKFLLLHYWLHHKKHPIYKKPCPPTYGQHIYKKKLPYFPPVYKKSFHHLPKYPPSHA